MRVAAVQGNGKAGYFDSASPATCCRRSSMRPRRCSGRQVDIVLWPEGSSDATPLTDPYTAQVFDTVATELDAAFLTGAVTERDGKTYNTSMLWARGGRGRLLRQEASGAVR